MGGSVGKALDPTGGNFLGLGGTVGRGVGAGLTGGLSEFGRTDPFGLPINNPLGHGSLFNGTLGNQGNPYVSGPFSLDPNQLAADQAAISGLGTSQYADANKLATSQYNQTMAQAPSLITKQLALDNPGIMESLNSTGQLNSTAYPTALAQQQAQLTNAITLPALQQLQSQQQGAQSNLFGTQNSGVGRQLSLEDFINQANVAKTIGAQLAPQVGNGKGNTGAVLSGTGALAQGIGSLAKAK